MKAQQFREMSTEQAVTETLENSKAIRNARRDIARVKTIIGERK
ncbi:MAG: 50S ribosomal protein L29 [Planctomycetota bacterium]|jgi:ribosomal protein L29